MHAKSTLRHFVLLFEMGVKQSTAILLERTPPSAEVPPVISEG